jgi:hypothetical protein
MASSSMFLALNRLEMTLLARRSEVGRLHGLSHHSDAGLRTRPDIGLKSSSSRTTFLQDDPHSTVYGRFASCGRFSHSGLRWAGADGFAGGPP